MIQSMRCLPLLRCEVPGRCDRLLSLLLWPFRFPSLLRPFSPSPSLFHRVLRQFVGVRLLRHAFVLRLHVLDGPPLRQSASLFERSTGLPVVASLAAPVAAAALVPGLEPPP